MISASDTPPHYLIVPSLFTESVVDASETHAPWRIKKSAKNTSGINNWMWLQKAAKGCLIFIQCVLKKTLKKYKGVFQY